MEKEESMWMRVINRYYSDNQPLKELLILHSRLVADKALGIATAHPELNLDRQFVEEAAMLHDIGIFLTDADAIHCYGKYHYLCHGYLGADLLRKEGLPRHALVAERHTGTGLTLKQILERDLPVCAPSHLRRRLSVLPISSIPRPVPPRRKPWSRLRGVSPSSVPKVWRFSGGGAVNSFDFFSLHD